MTDPRDASTTPLNFTKSINLALSERGINALRGAGHDGLLEGIFSTTIPMHGRMIHTKTLTGALKEEAQAYDVHGRFQRSTDRNDLSKRLLDKLATMPNVKIFYEQKLIGANFDAKKAWFEDLRAGPSYPGKRAPEYEVKFDLMLGTDGAHSAVRYHMMKYSRVDFSQEYIDCLWSEFTMLPDPSSKHPDGYRISPNHLHIWPAGLSMFIALPSPEGIFVCTLFAPSALFNKLESGDVNTLISTFDELFPGVTQLIKPEELQKQFRENPHLPLQNIRCTPHHYSSSVAILGDAANAMVPFYGQGMNAGLESVRVLWDIIDRSKEAQSRQEAGFSPQAHEDYDIDWHDPDQCLAAALREYTHSRTPDAHAIVDLAVHNYAEMRSGVVSKRYKMRKYIEETLDKYVHWLGWKTQYSRVSFGNEPYSQVITKAKRQGRILDGVFNVVGLSTLVGITYVVWKNTRWSTVASWSMNIGPRKITIT